MVRGSAGPVTLGDNVIIRTTENASAKRKAMIGSPVSVKCKWVAKVRYNYRTLFRGSKRDSLRLTAGRFTKEFQSIPEDWKNVVKSEIMAKNVKDWKFRIYEKEKFWWWDFDDWGVKIDPDIKLKAIEFKDPKDLDDESDSDSSIE